MLKEPSCRFSSTFYTLEQMEILDEFNKMTEKLRVWKTFFMFDWNRFIFKIKYAFICRSFL